MPQARTDRDSLSPEPGRPAAPGEKFRISTDEKLPTRDDGCLDAVIAHFEEPELTRQDASSTAVHASLQELPTQVSDEIATLSPLLAPLEGAERDRLAAALASRREIVERVHTVLVAGGHYLA